VAKHVPYNTVVLEKLQGSAARSREGRGRGDENGVSGAMEQTIGLRGSL